MSLSSYSKYLHGFKQKTHFYECFHKIPVLILSISYGCYNKVNRLYEKALRLVYRNKISFRNLQILATEICEAKNDLIPEIMKDIFCFVEKTYNLKKQFDSKRKL